MKSSIASLAPVLALLAFMLQGCIMTDYKPAVRIAIGHACEDKIKDFSDDVGLKDIVGAEGCDKLDADKLTEFGVTDCKTLLHDTVHFVLSVECEASVAGNITDKCKPFKGAECKTKLDEVVKKFEPFSEEGSSDAEGEDGFEAALGLVNLCSTQLNDVIDSDKVVGQVDKECEKTDDDAMTVMGVGNDKCKDYLKEFLHSSFTIICVTSAFLREDVPTSADDVTKKWITTAATEFSDAVKKELENNGEVDLGVFDNYKPAETTRLFQMLRKRQWPGKLRASANNFTIICGATLIVSVALMAIAWRRFGTQQGSPQNEGPILGDDSESNLE